MITRTTGLVDVTSRPNEPDTAHDTDLPDTPDVFLSYARENRPVAELLADCLGAHGLSVWWDNELSAGAEFSAVIEAKLQGAAVVIVLWSADSVRSVFVRDECSRALRFAKLLPVRIEDVELPLGFGQLHTLDLLAWDGDPDNVAFQKLLQDVDACRHRDPRRASEPMPLLASTGVAASAKPGWMQSTSRNALLMAGVTLTVAAGGMATWYVQDGQDRDAAAVAAKQAVEQRRIDADKVQADRHFSDGLEQQYAAVPQLEKALNDYLSAIELRPAHARAHFYLGHVYAQSGKPADALAQFKLALMSAEAPLDRSQRQEADKRVLALVLVPDEEAAITRPDSRSDTRTPTGAPVDPPKPAGDVAVLPAPAPVDATPPAAAVAGGVTPRGAGLTLATPK